MELPVCTVKSAREIERQQSTKWKQGSTERKPLRSLQIYMWVQLLFIFLFNTRKQLFIIFMIMILYIFVLLDTYLFSLQKLLFRPFSIFKFSVFGCKGSLYILNTSPLLSFLVRTFLVVLYKAQTEVILKLCQTTFPHKIIKN